jgi:phage portal protein BeeE
MPRPGTGAYASRMRTRAAGRAGQMDPRTLTWFSGTDPLPPYPASESEAMALPPFGRGVALLANAVADTDWYAARWDPTQGVFQRLAAQPSVVADPNPDVPTWNYRWAACQDGILFGNHFAYCGDTDSATNYPRELFPIPADMVWVMADPETGDFWWTINGEMVEPINLNSPMVDANGRPSQFGRIFHVPFGNRSGEVLGLGILKQYCDWLGGAVAAETHAASYFAGGALPPAVLQSPQVLTQTQADELKAAWRLVASTREPVVLPMGYVLTPLVSNAEQAQLVESRTWNAQAVAMMLGIPAYKLGLPGTTMTYQNVETADIDFIRDSVSRYASPLAAAFTKYLVPRGQVVRFDWAGRMRADQNTTSSVLRTYVDSGIMTQDEARAVIGRPPLELSTVEGTTPEDVPELTPAEVS